MTAVTAVQGNIVPFPIVEKRSGKHRKVGLNKNRGGLIRNINGKIYLDFIYLGERIREFSGLNWDKENAKEVRQQMDKIAISIKSGTFRFADVFPQSKKKEYFRAKESVLYGLKIFHQGSFPLPNLSSISRANWRAFETCSSSTPGAVKT